MKKLFIISGGTGREREVSLSSGKNCFDELSSLGVSCEQIIVGKDRSFLYNEIIMNEEKGLRFLQEQNALVFQLIHGTYGEDDEFVKKLEEYGVSYIGSPSSVQEKTINKYVTEQTLRSNHISTTTSILVSRHSTAVEGVIFPSIIKPNNEGSSIGVVMVNNSRELQRALGDGMKNYQELLVQPCIGGREVTCGVVEIRGEAVALPVTEIVLTKGEMFDYKAKYSAHGCLEVTPADIDEAIIKKIQQVALKTHKLMECRDISRTDMILTNSGEVVVLEINTVPGMTKTSFIPAQLSAARYTLKDFIEGMFIKYS